jgi:ABC-type long-subunit fatty acid transport system fused permease/ATPase subunit
LCAGRDRTASNVVVLKELKALREVKGAGIRVSEETEMLQL